MKAYPVTVLCKVMRVSRSGFYQYLKRFNQGPGRDPEKTALKARIQAIFNAHRSKYGARRIMKELNNQGHKIGIYKVRRLMRELGLKAKSPRRYKVTTDSRHSCPRYFTASDMLSVMGFSGDEKIHRHLVPANPSVDN